ncbi:MAG: nucleotidyltransferase family protein [Deltaproteobacteria bacterium]
MSPHTAWRPDDTQQLLLEACLLDDLARARESLDAWSRRADVGRLDSGSYRLLPLLWKRLPYLGSEFPSRDLLKGVYRRTWYANRLSIGRLSRLVSVIRAADVPAMVVKGVPLSLEAYRDAGVRPMGDGDLVVPRVSAHRAVETLVAAGWRPGVTPLTGAMVEGSPATARWTVGPRPLEAFDESYFGVRHAHGFATDDGFDVDLHWALFQGCCDRGADDAVWARAHPLDLGGEWALAPSPADHLLLLLAHGARWNPIPPIRWVADVVSLLRTSTPSWPIFLADARRRGLVVPARDMLTWLEPRFSVGVPREVLEALRSEPVEAADEHAWARRSAPPGVASGLDELAYLRDRHRALRSDPLAGVVPPFPAFVRHVLGAESLLQVGLYGAGEIARRLGARG